MSGHTRDSVTIYLRPYANVPPYQIDNCAKWLIQLGHFPNFHTAHSWIMRLYNYSPWKFKTLMSNYYAAHFDGHMRIKQGVTKYEAINRYQTGYVNSYGEEPHMYM